MGASVTGSRETSMLLHASKVCSLQEILLRIPTPVILLSLTEIRRVGDLHIKPNKEESQTQALVIRNKYVGFITNVWHYIFICKLMTVTCFGLNCWSSSGSS